MIDITVFSDTKIIFSTLLHILKRVPHGQVKKVTSLNQPNGRITGFDDAISKQVCRMFPQCSNQIGQYAIAMPPNG